MKKSELRSLIDLSLTELLSRANAIRQKEAGYKLDLCNIMNAKSGMCGEDCKFCAQSVRHSTGVDVYPLRKKKEILDAARHAKDIGAKRFGIVTSGNRLTKVEISKIAEAVSEIKAMTGVRICASLGELDEQDFALLKKAGLTRYHHNIETSSRYFAKIVTTHSFHDRINTIKRAQKAGLEVCSGGIIGMGENWADRIDMACLLKELDVDSVPLNILVPIKGTALEKTEPLSCADAIKTIAIFRIILKDKIIKIAAGRESALKDFQGLAFMAGANGMLIGGYLTVKGRNVDEDWRLVEEIQKVWKK